MKILICSYFIFTKLIYCTYTNQIVLRELGIEPVSIIKELAAAIDMLGSSKPPYNEDADLNVTQLIGKYVYPVQEHRVMTEDGYLLTMIRIKSNGPAIILMHGLLMSADDWVTAGPTNGLAYLLAEAGYDVWLGNARGNKHSREHIFISPDTPKFWDFSWDEIGRYDLPAMIDYVLHVTGKEKLAYIGHSQGNTAFFVMCSEKPEYNEKITIMIALAPVTWTSHMKSPLARMVAPFNYYDMALMKLFQVYEVLPKPLKNLYSKSSLCEMGNGIVCTTILFGFCGFDYEQLIKEHLPVIFGHMPSGASINQFVHYLQNIVSRSFRRYDYGKTKNLNIYGSIHPPKYAVNKITAPVALFYSHNDWLCDVKDVETLLRSLPNVIDLYRVPFNKFNHIDYLWAKDSKRLVYGRIAELLKFLEPRNMTTV